jgi:uncharacterized membrane protein
MIAPKVRAFSEVALIEYPRRGMYAIGFLSGKSEFRQEMSKRDMRLVFIPSTPTPFTGLVVLVPEQDVHSVDLGVEEAIKILVSGGIVAPSQIKIIEDHKNREVTHAPGQPVG